MTYFRRSDFFQSSAPLSQPHTILTKLLPESSNQMLQSKSILDPTVKKYIPKTDYENQLKVQLRMPNREEWHSILTIRIYMATIGNHNEQILNIELTDDSNPLFLYISKFQEADFIALKQEQKLLIDFHLFPYKLIELLEMCPVLKKPLKTLEEDDTDKRLCIMTMDDSGLANFDIVQTTSFNMFSHLSLRFVKADDETMKNYLAEKLQEFKAECAQLKQRLENTEDKFEIQVAVNDKLKVELRAEKEETERLADAIKLDAQRQFNDLKQKMLEEIEKQVVEHTAERNKLQKNLEEKVEDLSEKLASVTEKKDGLESKLLKLEATERELQSKVQRQEHEIQLKQNELDLLRSTNKNLDTTKYSQEKILVELRVRCETMEKQLQDKEKFVNNVNGLYEAVKQRCAHLEETITILKGNATRMEEKADSSAQENKKANETIAQLQADLKAIKQKVKLSEGVCVQQEQIIDQNKRSIDDLTRSLSAAKKETTMKEEEIKLCNGKIEELKSKLEESQKMLESNEQSTNSF